MDERTRDALNRAIRHWAFNEEGPIELAAVGPDACPLCALFIAKIDCAGCPVAARTGKPGCEGSPYREADQAFMYRDEDEPRWRAAARAEREFLESLIPSS